VGDHPLALLTQVLEPVVSGLFAIPITLFFPVFILMFGIGRNRRSPMARRTVLSDRAEHDRGLMRRRRALSQRGAIHGRFALRTVPARAFPAAFPVILTGLRIGFFICFASVLGGETISSVSGVGRNIALAAELMEPARMYAWIAFVIVGALC
jgi:ABC-type nitrate/sulfonate/bicarbonate transport system permease component